MNFKPIYLNKFEKLTLREHLAGLSGIVASLAAVAKEWALMLSFIWFMVIWITLQDYQEVKN